MKALWLPTFAALVGLALTAGTVRAQYKAPSQYFPKNFLAPANPGAEPAAPKEATPKETPPAKPQQPKFKDLAVNSTFYFLSDTNRAYPWVKLSNTSAKNTKNNITRVISGEMLIQR